MMLRVRGAARKLKAGGPIIVKLKLRPGRDGAIVVELKLFAMAVHKLKLIVAVHEGRERRQHRRVSGALDGGDGGQASDVEGGGCMITTVSDSTSGTRVSPTSQCADVNRAAVSKV